LAIGSPPESRTAPLAKPRSENVTECRGKPPSPLLNKQINQHLRASARKGSFSYVGTPRIRTCAKGHP
jgi:hypothetical protein